MVHARSSCSPAEAFRLLNCCNAMDAHWGRAPNEDALPGPAPHPPSNRSESEFSSSSDDDEYDDARFEERKQMDAFLP